MAQDTLYLKIEENVEVHDSHVVLKDIAQILCTNKDMENRLKVLKLPGFAREPGRHVVSVMEVIQLINQEFPSLEVNNIGEGDFIVTCPDTNRPGDWWSWCKTIAVSILVFFGSSFTIMTFNNDVDIPKLFSKLYESFVGQPPQGFTILEFTYSLGVGLGIIVFFNHFCGRKLTSDPTPLEVQMRIYEDNVNKTLLETSSRKPKSGKEG